MLLVCCYTFLSLFFPPSFRFAIHTHSNDACRLPPPPLTLLNSAGASFYFFSLPFFSKDFLQPMLGFMTGFVIDMHIRPLHIR